MTEKTTKTATSTNGVHSGERKPRNPMVLFHRYDRDDVAVPMAIPASTISAITISKRTGEVLVLMRPHGKQIIADVFTDAVRAWEKVTPVAVFHQWGDDAENLKIPVAIDQTTIISVEPSMVKGGNSAVVRTPTGLIAVTETFERAIEIAER